jgi:LmbE family N-acetylglucosaminyl deacetylase
MRKLAGVYLFLLFSLQLLAQSPQSWTSAEMYQALRKLNVLGSVLYVAAHPDDENTRLIAYLSKDKLYQTGYLSITRGDGGQNLIGDEQGIELGLIRTQELLAARRIDGGEQFFTRAYDFGYSKTPEETFTKWDKEKILSDVVWVIRKFQPDVIITRFPTTGEGGHGHHTASAILANEAFTAAADPNRFPDQLKYVQPWQAKRVLWNSFNFGGTNLTSPDQFKFDVGGYNPLLGKSYGEIAAESRSQHKSQGFGVPAGRGEAMEFFRTTKGSVPTTDLMDEVDLSWKRVKGGEAIEKMVNELSSSFDFLKPDKSVKGLVALYKALLGMEDGHWKNKKLKEVEQLIAQCSGLFIDATASEQFAVQTDSIRVNFSFNNRLGVDAVLQKVTIDAFDSTFSKALDKNKNLNFSKTFYVPATKNATQPYWLANKMEEGYFNVNDQQSIGQPDVDPAFNALVQVKIFGESFSFSRPVKYKFTDPVRGELYQPLVVIPPVVLSVDDHIKIALNEEEIKGVVTAYAKRKNVAGTIYTDAFLKQQKEEMVAIPDANISIDTKNSSTSISYTIKPKADRSIGFLVKEKTSSLVSIGKLNEVKYDHVPIITYFSDDKILLRRIDLKTHGKKIGYIIGAGDKVPEALEQMGYEVILFTDKELSRNNLSQFDAIITGVRAYNTNEWMNNHYDKLMKYVNDGGNLIVQYNTSNQIGPVRAKIAPYNFNITRTRITDENAPVTLLKPEHPVFNFPNKITQDDFKGWVQERSIYHGSDTTGKFEKVLSMNDPGEKAEDGSLLIAKYGKGFFTYTGLVFFRELPAGVPGAYRLLANIIALNRKKGF